MHARVRNCFLEIVKCARERCGNVMQHSLVEVILKMKKLEFNSNHSNRASGGFQADVEREESTARFCTQASHATMCYIIQLTVNFDLGMRRKVSRNYSKAHTCAINHLLQLTNGRKIPISPVRIENLS